MASDETCSLDGVEVRLDCITEAIDALRPCLSDDPPTLRDRFAMAALTGMLAENQLDGEPESFVRAAYRYADLMLAAREKSGGAK
jgi:hypothetical protein